MDMMLKVVTVLCAYFLGAIPFSYIVGKLSRGINILEHGSGNAGATNTLRVLGVRLGILVLFCDMGKGVLAAYLGFLAGGHEVAALTAMVAILGHTFSVFIKFKGGKGVATAAGALIFLAPDVFFMAFCVWFLVAALTRYISLASVIGASSVVIFSLIFVENIYVRILLVIFASYIIWKHRDNIKRLREGTEKKISFKWRI